MDKESIAEYGYLVITIMVASLLIVFLTGSFFTGNMNSVVSKTIPDHEANSYLGNSAFADYIVRTPPTLTCAKTITVKQGETLDLKTKVTAANADKLDLTNEIIFLNKDNEVISSIFDTSTIGTFKIKARVIDKTDSVYYGKVTEKTFEIIVKAENNSVVGLE